jgi:hypothetical protein
MSEVGGGTCCTWRVVTHTAPDTVSAADALGYPVVLKAADPNLVHKSDVGGVRLKLTAAAVTAAYQAVVVATGTPAALRFTGVTANRAPLASAGSVNRLDLARGNRTLTRTSNLKGGAFTITWLHTFL